jgi:hypothetical protein
LLIGIKVFQWHGVSAIHQLSSSGLREGEIHLHEQMGSCSQEKAPLRDVIQLIKPLTAMSVSAPNLQCLSNTSQVTAFPAGVINCAF